MPAGKKMCCGIKLRETYHTGMELPEKVREELEHRGGLEALAKKIPGKEELEEKSRAFHALSDPLRLTILYLLKDQPLCVCIIIWYLRMSGSKLSYHLSILKEAGFIEGEYHGNWIIYTITPKGRKTLK